ncbi:hypothetical protein NC796_15120 [Aliifodinibius sp. S!AR15-10]|uniref:hypothetical protein n=1 Tax=Aliifodinibius sp. S!AR15-10 TaxID=2950437 RepID=UPI002857D968|nr:hypothetical protein [Aliifodinibius sp. S!AR15-10]MDR8392484.1 hypothetical protein [Aliifodinibius sp. S!AR15-10]
MKLLKNTRFLVVTLLVLGISIPVLAQNEIERERSSLKGIAEMGFTVNIEANVSLNEKGELEITSIKQQAVDKLEESGLTIIPDSRIRSSADLPYLYMHINTMDAGQGLVPFSVSLDFYQPAELTLNRNLQTSVSTWQTGLVGIVSYDRMNVIGESAVNLLDDFIKDYNQVNL